MKATANTTAAKVTREMMIEVVMIMKAQIEKFNGSNDQAWEAAGNEIMNRFEMTEKGALLLMRGAMSVVTGMLHPVFQN